MNKKTIGVITASIVASASPLAAQTKTEEPAKKVASKSVSRDAIYETFKKHALANVKGIKADSFKVDQNFTAIGGHSLMWANAVSLTLKEYGVTVPDGKLDNMKKVSDFVDLVEEGLVAKRSR